MTAYEKELLALAVKECRERGFDVRFEVSGSVIASSRYESRIFHHHGPEALTALLRDLGVEVPEPPDEERVASIAMSLEFVGGDRVKFLRSVDRLALLALLEGGGS